MKKAAWSVLFLLWLSVSAQAQDVYNSSGRRGNSSKPKKQQGFDPSKLIFGGGIGLGFGDITSISASPVLGYRFTDRFAAGIGVAYQYLRVKDYTYLVDQGVGKTYPLHASLLAPSLWARFLVIENIFLHAEAEYDFQSWRYSDYDNDPYSPTYTYPKHYREAVQSPALLLGGGFRQPVGTNSSFIIMALYDVLQHENSPYRRRVDFRFGFNIGF